MADVWDDQTLSATDKIVMLSLADHADDDGWCYPSISRLVRRTGLKERTVQNAIKRLKAAGKLVVNLNAGRGLANLYQVLPTPAADAPRSKCTPAADAPNPPHLTTQTPAADAPKPSITTIETSLFGDPPKQKRKRACSIPENWVPSDRNIQDALSRNFSEREISDEADRFRDYHLAKGTTFKDWDAAWRTWLGNSRKFSRDRGVAFSAGSGKRGQGSGLAGELARRRLAGQ